jgi:hypothetical protein
MHGLKTAFNFETFRFTNIRDLSMVIYAHATEQTNQAATWGNTILGVAHFTITLLFPFLFFFFLCFYTLKLSECISIYTATLNWQLSTNTVSQTDLWTVGCVVQFHTSKQAAILWLLWLDHAVPVLLNCCFKNYNTTTDFLHSVWVINCDILGKLFLTGGGWNFSSLGWKLDLHWSCSWKGPRKSDIVTESTWGKEDVSLTKCHCFILHLFIFSFLFYFLYY